MARASLVPLLAAVLAALAATSLGCASRTSVAEPVQSTANAPRAVITPEVPGDLVFADAPNEHIMAVHRSKCGSCHARVEPGSISRATAESAMQRHRRRAKLTAREWEDMVDLLSADHLTHARPTARLP
jgi:hypothetical protein